MSKKITMKIDPKTGMVEVKTEGYSGPECLEATKDLEKNLGMNQGCAVPTDEMYSQPVEEQQKVGE